MTENVLEIIGFDLGHGETSIALAPIVTNAEPRMLEVDSKRTQITALGTHRDLGFVVGDKALSLPGVKDQRICFKQKPPGDEGYEEILRNFLATYNRLLISRGLIRGGEKSFYFVGCPSGWKEEEVKVYEQFLRSSGVQHLKVVRESRAALLQAREAGSITDEQLKTSVIVIDVGSLTIDVTHVFGGIQDELLDIGINLGASIIEKIIFDRSIECNPKRDDMTRLLDDPENSHIRSQCELLCRRAKEQYWQEEESVKGSGLVIAQSLGFEDGYIFQARVDSQEMEEIINMPLPELDGRSWIDAFESLLVYTKRQLDERGIAPSAVVLTGGASRMSFIERLCKEHYKDAAFIRYSPPEETVAYGLARWGQIYLNTSSFSEEIENLCEQRVSESVLSYKSNLISLLVEAITEGVINYAAVPAMKKWRTGDIKRLKEIDSEISKRAEEWILSESGHKTITQILSNALKPVYAEVNFETMKICNKYNIPHSSLYLGVTISPQEELYGINVSKPFEGGFGIAAGITFLIIFVLTGSLKVAVATGGPAGWLILILTSLWALLFSVPFLEEKVNDADLPILIRETVLSDAKIEKLIKDLRPKLNEKFEEALSSNHLDKVIQTISDQIRNELNEKANEVKWIIS